MRPQNARHRIRWSLAVCIEEEFFLDRRCEQLHAACRQRSTANAPPQVASARQVVGAYGERERGREGERERGRGREGERERGREREGERERGREGERERAPGEVMTGITHTA
jgi:hypothetical protein